MIKNYFADIHNPDQNNNHPAQEDGRSLPD
jgi:hypothetical protein